VYAKLLCYGQQRTDLSKETIGYIEQASLYAGKRSAGLTYLYLEELRSIEEQSIIIRRLNQTYIHTRDRYVEMSKSFTLSERISKKV
jgi:hypothetical protein